MAFEEQQGSQAELEKPTFGSVSGGGFHVVILTVLQPLGWLDSFLIGHAVGAETIQLVGLGARHDLCTTAECHPPLVKPHPSRNICATAAGSRLAGFGKVYHELSILIPQFERRTLQAFANPKGR